MTDRSLTPREDELLRLMAEGIPMKQAAWRLGITEQTVKNHLTSIYQKLDVRSLVGALRARGWICVPSTPVEDAT